MILKIFINSLLSFAFLAQAVCPGAMAADILALLPAPGTMTGPSEVFQPASLKGVRLLEGNNGLRLEFVLVKGQDKSPDANSKETIDRLVSYFLSALTLQSDNMWVNLSPYEGDRIIPDNFGTTAMGRDLLAQDYLLKQLSASLLYPEKDLGKKFWDEVYRQTKDRFGVTDLPVATFNKVWIVPETATVYENGMTGYILKSHLKVMLESDYEAARHANTSQITQRSFAPEGAQDDVAKNIMREIIIPAIEKEVNEGRQFATLRQIYDAQVLAVWFKTALRSSTLGQAYADQNKVAGIDTNSPAVNEALYQRYLEAFKLGAFNYVKEQRDPATQELLPRKYFSGGAVPVTKIATTRDFAAISDPGADTERITLELAIAPTAQQPPPIHLTKRQRRNISTSMIANISPHFLSLLEHGSGTLKSMDINSLFSTLISMISLATQLKADALRKQGKKIPEDVARNLAFWEEFHDLFRLILIDRFQNLQTRLIHAERRFFFMNHELDFDKVLIDPASAQKAFDKINEPSRMKAAFEQQGLDLELLLNELLRRKYIIRHENTTALPGVMEVTYYINQEFKEFDEDFRSWLLRAYTKHNAEQYIFVFEHLEAFNSDWLEEESKGLKEAALSWLSDLDHMSTLLRYGLQEKTSPENRISRNVEIDRLLHTMKLPGDHRDLGTMINLLRGLSSFELFDRDKTIAAIRDLQGKYIPGLQWNMLGETALRKVSRPVDLVQFFRSGTFHIKGENQKYIDPGHFDLVFSPTEPAMVKVFEPLFLMAVERCFENAANALRRTADLIKAKEEAPVPEEKKDWLDQDLNNGLTEKDLRITINVATTGKNARIIIENPGWIEPREVVSAGKKIMVDPMKIDPQTGIQRIFSVDPFREEWGQGGTSMRFVLVALWNLGAAFKVENVLDSNNRHYVRYTIDFAQEATADNSREDAIKGGIDLNEKNLDLHIEHHNGTVAAGTLPEELMNITGLVPVLIDVAPLPDLAGYLNPSVR